MSEPWIRVHARLVDRPIIAKMCDALGVKPMAAIGHLVTFWGCVSAHVTNGDISQVPDDLLDRWACWTGKRGAFAQWVRATHVDATGRVKEWDDYQGKLETRRQRERDRQESFRQKRRAEQEAKAATTGDDTGSQPDSVRVTPAPEPDEDTQRRTRDIRVTSRVPYALRHAEVATHARERDGTGRKLQVQDQVQDQKLVAADASTTTSLTWVAALTEQWSSKVGPVQHGRVGKVLKPLVDAFGASAVTAGLRDYLSTTSPAKANLTWFAEHGTFWCKESLAPAVDANGNLTPRAQMLLGGPL